MEAELRLVRLCRLQAPQRRPRALKSNAEYGSLEGFAPSPPIPTHWNHMFRFQRIGIRRWKAVKWIVEYRSPLAGEDMPRKPLDSLEAAHAPGHRPGV